MEINLDPTKWKYLSHSDPESMYRVYEYRGNYSYPLGLAAES